MMELLGLFCFGSTKYTSEVFAGGISGFKPLYSSPVLQTYADALSGYHFNWEGGLLSFLTFLHRNIDLNQGTFLQ